jgi:predicted nucleic acid-binding protein
VSVVLDASLTLSWYFEDERTPAADALLDRVTNTGAVAPSIWRFETANGFQMAIRRQRIDPGFRDRALFELARLPIAVDTGTDACVCTTTLQLADRYRLTVYDAVYLALAQRKALRLATLDGALRSAAASLGLTLRWARENWDLELTGLLILRRRCCLQRSKVIQFQPKNDSTPDGPI